MSKMSRILLSLVGAVPAGWFLYVFFLKGVVGEIASMPLPMMLGTGLAAASSAILALVPLLTAAGVFGGGGAAGPKKAKKGKAAADESGDFAESDESLVESDGESFESFEGSASDLEASDDFEPVDGDDPFEVTDNFESDIADADFDSQESEVFEDDFEIEDGPDSRG